jgi:hypothetical protein
MYEIFNSENIKVVIEWNGFGGELMKNLQTIFPQRNDFDEENVVKFKHRKDAKSSQFGLKVKNDNKVVMCLDFKKFIRYGKIELFESNTIREAKEFAKTSSGTSYKGMKKHDDLIMSSINAGEFFTTVDYSDFVEELQDIIDEEVLSQMTKELEKHSKGDGNLYFDIYSIVQNK